MTEQYLILHKPLGLPCMAHVSNKQECLHVCAERALGYDTLHLLHRIDYWTSGLVSVASSTHIIAFCAWLNYALLAICTHEVKADHCSGNLVC
jgi:23S rRNA-/tRNA-specific pseudouridylate synthase